jgi:hypothetical protein
MKVSVLNYGFRIGEIAIPTRYHEKALSTQLLKGFKFLVETYFMIISYLPHKWGIGKSKLCKPT